jgi:hypothetical protein
MGCLLQANREGVHSVRSVQEHFRKGYGLPILQLSLIEQSGTRHRQLRWQAASVGSPRRDRQVLILRPSISDKQENH